MKYTYMGNAVSRIWMSVSLNNLSEAHIIRGLFTRRYERQTSACPVGLWDSHFSTYTDVIYAKKPELAVTDQKITRHQAK